MITSKEKHNVKLYTVIMFFQSNFTFIQFIFRKMSVTKQRPLKTTTFISLYPVPLITRTPSLYKTISEREKAFSNILRHFCSFSHRLSTH